MLTDIEISSQCQLKDIREIAKTLGLKEEDLSLATRFAKVGVPMIVAFTKTDIMPKENIPEELVKLGGIQNE